MIRRGTHGNFKQRLTEPETSTSKKQNQAKPRANGRATFRGRANRAGGGNLQARRNRTKCVLSLEDPVQKGGSCGVQASANKNAKASRKNRSKSGARASARKSRAKRCALSKHYRALITQKKSELGLEGDLTGRKLKPGERRGLLEAIELAKDLGVSCEESCRVLKLNSRAVYRWIAKDIKNKKHGGGGGFNKITAAEEKAIVDLAKKRPDYRCRRIAYELEQKQRIFVGKTTVSEVMKKHGLNHEFVRLPKKQVPPIAQQLYFEPYRKNLIWGLDWTYLRVAGKFMFLLIVVDWYSRLIVSWGLFHSITKHEVVAVVTDASAKQQIDLLPEGALRPTIVADHGSPNTAKYTADNIEYLGLDLWLCGIARPTGNARTERTFGTLKREEISLEENYINEQYAQERLGKKIHDFNFYRPNIGNGGFAPAVIHQHGRKKMTDLRKTNRQTALNERLNNRSKQPETDNQSLS